jgi:hypothetical protein
VPRLGDPGSAVLDPVCERLLEEVPCDLTRFSNAHWNIGKKHVR